MDIKKKKKKKENLSLPSLFHKYKFLLLSFPNKKRKKGDMMIIIILK